MVIDYNGSILYIDGYGLNTSSSTEQSNSKFLVKISWLVIFRGLHLCQCLVGLNKALILPTLCNDFTAYQRFVIINLTGRAYHSDSGRSVLFNLQSAESNSLSENFSMNGHVVCQFT